MSSNSNNKIMFTIFLTIFIDMVGVGILIPILPLLVLPHSIFKVIPDTWSNQSGFIVLGWLSASFPLAQFIMAPILGQLSDRFGRKKILALSITGTAISYLLFAIAISLKNIPLLFISRIMDGCSGGNISVSQAVIADISKPENRAKNFAVIGMAFGIGFVFGPFIGGKFADPNTISWFNAATPFYFTCILSILNIVFVLKFLPETLKVKTSQRIDITRPLHNIAIAFSKPGLRNIMPTTYLTNAGFTFFTTFFAVTLAQRFHFNQGEVGNFFAYMGFMIIIAQGLIVRRISKKVSDYQILRFSIFGTALSLLIFFFIPSTHSHLLYYVPPLLATCNALTMAFSASLITRVTPINLRGEGLGINSSVIALAQVIPAILSGYVAELGTGVPTLVGSIIVICGGICFWLLFNPKLYINNK